MPARREPAPWRVTRCPPGRPHRKTPARAPPTACRPAPRLPVVALPIRLLTDFARLVAVFGAPEEHPLEGRRAVLRAAARGARRTALAAEVSLDGLHVGGRLVPADGDLRGLLSLLAAHGVGRLVVRQHAPASEIAQLAGILARQGANGDMVEELSAMRLWHVQLDPAPEAIPGATDPLPHAAQDLLRRLRDARGPAQVAEVFEAFSAWVDGQERAADAAPAGREALADPTPLLRVLAEAASVVLEQDPALDDGRMARFATLLVGLDLQALVDGAVGGAVPGGTLVLQCIAPAAVPLLLERLGTATSITERQRCCDVLFQLGSGLEVLIAGLQDPRWYIVRNVALVLGELRAEAAVRPLARHLHAADPRVRDAAARALSQIDTGAAMLALLPALRDRSVEVRRLAARATARAARRHAMIGVSTCIAALEAEEDAEVTHELFGALGGLGTADAIHYLLRVVTGATRSAHDPMLRLAAMEAIAGSSAPAAAEVTAALSTDSDPTVRRIAWRVLNRQRHRLARAG